MFFTKTRIILWRIWDFVVKSIWGLLPNSSKNLLRTFISSKAQIKTHVEDSLIASEGVIIQVGANDGVSLDPLYESILRYKRQSFLIEPVDYLAEKLCLLHKSNPFVTICQFAIHPSSSSVDFFHLPRDANKKMGALWKPWFDQIGSFSKQHLIKHSSFIEPFIEKTTIPCSTLNRLIIDNNVESIAILHIDAEGFDLEVLKTIDLELIKPHMIMLEHKHLALNPLLTLVSHMKKLGYKAYVYHDDIVLTINS